MAALFWSALAAGLLMGFSFLAAAYLTDLALSPRKPAAAAAGYPLGFIFVVLARNQLFTENTLEPIIPLLHAPSWTMLQQLIKLWAVVLLGNLAGTAIFVALVVGTPLLDPAFGKTLNEVARAGTSGGFAIVLYRGIFGGWLIALMAWLLAATRATGAQLILIWLTTVPIAAFGFRHSIAGVMEAFYLAFAGAVGWGRTVFGSVIPAVIGNVIGGVLLVALLNHGQIGADRNTGAEQG